MTRVTTTIASEHAVIRRIVDYAESTSDHAGVGASETAGVIVSFLRHRPDLMPAFMAGSLSALDSGMLDHHNGSLSWQGQDGRIHEPDPAKARLVPPTAEAMSDLSLPAEEKAMPMSSELRENIRRSIYLAFQFKNFGHEDAAGDFHYRADEIEAFEAAVDVATSKVVSALGAVLLSSQET